MRALPALDASLRSQVDAAVAIARAGETARLALPVGSPAWRELHVPRLELLYELAFLRVFVEWEIFLEQTLIRLMCGYVAKSAPTVLKAGAVYAKSIAAAQTALLGKRHYLLWHDPSKVVARAAGRFTTSSFQAVIASNTSRLEHFAAVRHRVAHGQADARANFDVATMQLNARRYRGARAGQFLRDWDTAASPQIRWLESIANELCSLAAQMV